MKPIYDLSALGDSLDCWGFRMKSKRLLETPQLAETYIEEFKTKCCDREHWDCAEEDTLKISIIEYELYQGD